VEKPRGLGFGVWGLGFGVWGLGFGVWGLGFGVWGLGFGVWGLGFGVSSESKPIWFPFILFELFSMPFVAEKSLQSKYGSK
jgi:hypothetical protein